MRVLILYPHRPNSGRTDTPRRDYEVLRDVLRRDVANQVGELDLTAVDRSRSPVIRTLARLIGADWGLAWLAWRAGADYDVVYSHAERIGIPLALLLKLVRRRPRHVMAAYHLSGMRMRAWFRLLRVHRQIDLVLLSARPQYDLAVTELGVPASRVRLSEALCIVDSDHYAPRADEREEDSQICAIGVEYRDYATLFAAITTLPAARLKVDAHSPWSMLPDPILGLEPPSNVELCRLEFGTARRLYAASGIVAIPLHPNDKAAGTTTLLEAMSMGKAVVVTRTTGNLWALDGETVLMVEPGDVEGWHRALARLLEDGALRRRLGTNARRWIEANAACDLRAEQTIAALRG